MKSSTNTPGRVGISLENWFQLGGHVYVYSLFDETIFRFSFSFYSFLSFFLHSLFGCFTISPWLGRSHSSPFLHDITRFHCMKQTILLQFRCQKFSSYFPCDFFSFSVFFFLISFVQCRQMWYCLDFKRSAGFERTTSNKQSERTHAVATFHRFKIIKYKNLFYFIFCCCRCFSSIFRSKFSQQVSFTFGIDKVIDGVFSSCFVSMAFYFDIVKTFPSPAIANWTRHFHIR